MGIVIEGKYGWCLDRVAIFMGFIGAKRWEDSLKSSFEVTMQATRWGVIFMGKEGSLTM